MHATTRATLLLVAVAAPGCPDGGDRLGVERSAIVGGAPAENAATVRIVGGAPAENAATVRIVGNGTCMGTLLS